MWYINYYSRKKARDNISNACRKCNLNFSTIRYQISRSSRIFGNLRQKLQEESAGGFLARLQV
jgi:hypothetical protein